MVITSNFLFEKDIKNGRSNPGTIIEPNVYQIWTTEGILIAIINEINTVTNKPFLTKGTVFSTAEMFSLFCVFLILHIMSLPNVVALINVSESIVDIITDNTPMKKIPMANWGSTNSANCKYANDGFPSGIKALAYNPEKSVNISKTNQKQTDNKIPFRAIIGDFAAAHLW